MLLHWCQRAISCFPGSGRHFFMNTDGGRAPCIVEWFELEAPCELWSIFIQNKVAIHIVACKIWYEGISARSLITELNCLALWEIQCWHSYSCSEKVPKSESVSKQSSHVKAHMFWVLIQLLTGACIFLHCTASSINCTSQLTMPVLICTFQPVALSSLTRHPFFWWVCELSSSCTAGKPLVQPIYVLGLGLPSCTQSVLADCAHKPQTVILSSCHGSFCAAVLAWLKRVFFSVWSVLLLGTSEVMVRMYLCPEAVALDGGFLWELSGRRCQGGEVVLVLGVWHIGVALGLH